MKKTLLGFLCLILCISSLGQSKNTDATALLKKVSSRYKSMKTIRSQFLIQFENLKDKSNNAQKAQLVVSGKKFRLELQDQKLFCDGQTLYTYSPEVNEVQIDHYKQEAGEINLANLFTIYETGFTSLLVGEASVNKKTYMMVDLTPIDKKKNYFKIRLWIEKSTNQLQTGKVFQKNGSNITYTINNISPTPPAIDKEFLFDKKLFPGVEIIDMR